MQIPQATPLIPSRRPLTESERRAVRVKIKSLSATGRRASKSYLPITAVGIFFLWLLTLLASDAPWAIVTVFWLVVGGGIALWVRREMRQDAEQFSNISQGLESALRRNEADVYDIRATAFIEFQEIEDEGACYAFEMDGGRVVFISGQEFYPAARFPSLDFSLVYVLDEQGQAVDMLIDKRGDKASPARTVLATVKQKLELPDQLEVVRSSMKDLENRIDSASPAN